MALTEQQIVDRMIEAVHVAGDRALEGYGSIASTLKHDGSVVTEADRAAEEYLRGVIAECFAGHRVFGEEGGGEDDICRGPVWLIDPIDGTNNFAHVLPIWGVSAGLIRDGQPALGVVYYPVMRETFWAIAGDGAFCNGVPISADRADKAERNDIFGVTASDWSDFRLCTKTKVRALGAATACCTHTAAGRFISAFVTDWKVWDIGAGLCIAKEAGCVCVDLNGSAVGDFVGLDPRGKQVPLLISGPGVWEEFLKCVQESDWKTGGGE